MRRWHREGRLVAGQRFTNSWTYSGGESAGTIHVLTEDEAVVLMYRERSLADKEWKTVKQIVPITWTECRFGGKRPWFICSVYSDGQYCGRRVAILYGAGKYFACRCCHDLTYASQQEPLRERGFLKARKIRMRLGGDANVLAAFPEKPTRMHWRTYERLCRSYQDAKGRSMERIRRLASRLQRRIPARKRTQSRS